MIGKKIESTIRLRRDNDYNYELIKNTFIPASGEIVLVDTAKEGLRAKVGDGVSTYAELRFTDEDIRNAALQGYLSNNVFYKDITLQTPFPKMINKIYIDKLQSKAYYFNGIDFLSITTTLVTANEINPGIVKLYNTVGYNTDGTMTQKSITDELDLRYKASIEPEDELLVFSL